MRQTQVLVLLLLLINIQISLTSTSLKPIYSEEDKIQQDSDVPQHERAQDDRMDHENRREKHTQNQQVENQSSHPLITKSEHNGQTIIRHEPDNLQLESQQISNQVTSQQYKQTKIQNTLLINSQTEKNRASSSTIQKLDSIARLLQSSTCSIAYCKQCTSYSTLNPNFALQPNDLYPTNDHPRYAQEFCNVCNDGYFLYRHPVIADQLSLFIKSNYTQIDGLVSVLSTVIEEQESCTINTQKVVQASIRIIGLNFDSYLDHPDFFKPWLLNLMQKYQLKKENLHLLFAQQGSLILKYWFNVNTDFQPNGDVADDVFNSGIQKIYKGSKVTDFNIDEIKNLSAPEKPSSTVETPSSSNELVEWNSSLHLTKESELKNTVSINGQDKLTPTELSQSEQSSPQNMVAIIIVGTLSAILLSVAAIYMICIRKKKEEQDEQKKQSQQIKTKDVIKSASKLVIKDEVSQNSKQKSKQSQQNNPRETSILKHDKFNFSNQNKDPEQKTQSFLKRIMSFLSRKSITEVHSDGLKNPKISSNKIQSMDDFAKSNTIESSKPLGAVPEFI